MQMETTDAEPLVVPVGGSSKLSLHKIVLRYAQKQLRETYRRSTRLFFVSEEPTRALSFVSSPIVSPVVLQATNENERQTALLRTNDQTRTTNYERSCCDTSLCRRCLHVTIPKQLSQAASTRYVYIARLYRRYYSESLSPSVIPYNVGPGALECSACWVQREFQKRIARVLVLRFRLVESFPRSATFLTTATSCFFYPSLRSF